MLNTVGNLYHYHMERGQAWLKNRFCSQYFRRKKLQKLLQYIVRFIPFYADFKNTCFHSLPIIDKTTFQENFKELNFLNIMSQGLLTNLNPLSFHVNQSAGTVSRRGVYVAKKEEILLEFYNLKKLFNAKKKLKKIAVFHFSAKPYFPTHLLKEYSWCLLDLQNDFKKLVFSLENFRADVIIGPSQALYQLAKWQQSKKISLNIKKIISTAEVLTPHQEKTIATAFEMPVHQLYQCAKGWLGHTCEYGVMHLNEDAYYIEKEWVDKENRRFIPIITSLTRYVHPVVRYRMEDILILKAKPCPCANHGMAIEKIVGRCEDTLYFSCRCFSPQLKPIYAEILEKIISSASGGIKQYQFLQQSPAQLTIKLQAKNMLLAQTSIEKLLGILFEKEKLKVPQITFALFEEIQLDEMFRPTMRMPALSVENN